MHEFDLLRGEDQDVLDIEFWTSLVDRVRKDPPFCIIATPPCSTYSRARHFYKESPGPRPIRSRQFPLGFPQKAEEGTALACKMWELFDIAREIGSHFLGVSGRSGGHIDRCSGLRLADGCFLFIVGESRCDDNGTFPV